MRAATWQFAAGGRGRLASGQAIPLDLEVGYRWVDVSGNERMYRTQINDRPGFLLRSFDYTSTGRSAAAFSTTSTSTARTSARVPQAGCACRPGQVDLFKLNFTWRKTDLYSALPAFANPFLAEGIIPGQQTYNRHAQHLRRDAGASSRQGHQPAPRLHAQHVSGPRARRRITSAATSSVSTTR